MKVANQMMLDLNAYHSIGDLVAFLAKLKVIPFIMPGPAIAQGYMVRYRKRL